MIGDLDVGGAEAVVSTITKDGGCVILAVYVTLEIEFLFHRRKAVATKCNVVSWDDQLSLFELAIEKYGAVDIVVCIFFSLLFLPGLIHMLTIIDPKCRNHRK